MINIRQALEWYDHFDEDSHLPLTAAVEALYHALNSATTEEEVRRMEPQIEQFLAENLQTDDPLQRSEGLIKTAVLKFEHNQIQESGVLLEKAAAILEEVHDQCRLATARWMLGMVQFKLKDNYLGYHNWNDARRHFQDLALGQAAANAQSQQPGNREWYVQQLQLINIDLARITTEAYEWAGDQLIEGFHIGVTCRWNIDVILDCITTRQFNRAYDLLKTLPDNYASSRNPLEKGEVKLTMGLCYSLMSNHEKAIDLLRQALSEFPASSHQQAAILWMIGSIFWQSGNSLNLAISTWQQALDLVRDLRQVADHRNEAEQVTWYEERIVIMEEILQNQLRDTYPF